MIDGQRVTLVRTVASRAAPARRTPSGSVAAPPSQARVAQASRIFVEGKHDVELVERVWGNDLRAEGVVAALDVAGNGERGWRPRD